ncbi:hypothetical protein OIU84_014473 [Salix udensis]|uniref:Endonuclease/exonuclease/phosphatase domain-containing protein n=1 Tax=Salix udensis TaxID=889485 RepID=A0AAD6NS19_9ROSI|nr:hypothetical protein OIU84_014473 [Salix udensis]
MAVHQWVRKNKLDLFGILEPKVLASNLEAIHRNMDNQEWEYSSNIQAVNPCRILVGWNPNKVLVDNVRSEEQWLTCEITNKITKDQFSVTFVYGYNSPTQRRNLWQYLRNISPGKANVPWMVMGDFNATLRLEDRYGGDRRWLGHHEEFRSSINHAGVDRKRGGHFKFLNLWADRDNFMDIIRDNWNRHLQGSPMMRLSANLY